MFYIGIAKSGNMPNNGYHQPPATRYEVQVEELLKALNGQPFQQGNGLYKIHGSQIEKRVLFGETDFHFCNNTAFVILIHARVVGCKELSLVNDTLTNYGVGFIFFKSILPGIQLKKAITGDWLFYNSCCEQFIVDEQTQIGDVWIKHQSQTKDIWIEGGSKTGAIHVHQNSSNRDIRIGQHSHCAQINIYKNSKNGYIFVNSHATCGAINITNNSITKKIAIDHEGCCHAIHIDDNSQTGYVNVYNQSVLQQLTVENHSQCGDICIDSNKETTAIAIKGKSQTGNMYCTNARIANTEIEDNYFGIQLSKSQVQQLQLVRCLLTFFEWTDGTTGEVYINGKSRAHCLRVTNTTIQKDSVLSLSDTEVQYCQMEEVLVQGTLLLRKISPPSKAFEWRSVDSYLGKEPEGIWEKEIWDSKQKLFQTQVTAYRGKLAGFKQYYSNSPLFRISHSSLNKTEITGSNLACFHFEYYNSKLLDCFITGTQLPREDIQIHNPASMEAPLNINEEYEQQTAICHQFKKIHENQGDVVGASVFHARSMHYQHKLLWWKLRNEKHSVVKTSAIFFDGIAFELNRLSNNHGESWSRALLFTVTCAGLFFVASLWGLTYWGNWGIVKASLHKLPGFMLPTHTLLHLSENVAEYKPNTWYAIWDFIGRIFMGYGFFQLIAAFRRHGKKSG